MFSEIPSDRNGFALDLGCGTGKSIQHMEKNYHRMTFTGLDFSSTAVAKAKEKGIEAIEFDLDSDTLPAEKSSIELITALDVIEHVFDPIGLLTNCYESLREGGSIYGIVPNDMHYLSRIRAIWGVSPVSRTYRKLGVNKHHTVMSRELLVYMLEEAGFNRLRVNILHSGYMLPKNMVRIPESKMHILTIFPGNIIFSAKKNG